ncbi:MAG: hypothetical protein ABJC40_08545, partial [Parasphingorhabdus sp.]
YEIWIEDKPKQSLNDNNCTRELSKMLPISPGLQRVVRLHFDISRDFETVMPTFGNADEWL